MPHMNQYQKLEELGQGTFGRVYKAKRISSGHVVAIKEVQCHGEGVGVHPVVIREIALLKSLDHPNIVGLQAVIHHRGKLVLVLDYATKDLSDIIEKIARQKGPRARGLGSKVVKSYLRQIVCGIKYLHVNSTMHRDLKPGNILVDADNVIKIADLGLSKGFYEPLRANTNKVVTLQYRAPELLLGQDDYSPAIDVWSIGCIFAEMLCRDLLWPDTTEYEILLSIFQRLGTPNEASWLGVSKLPHFSKEFPKWPPPKDPKAFPGLKGAALDLLVSMLKCNPRDRICTTSALRHSYFADKPVQMTDAIAEKISIRKLQPKQDDKKRTSVCRKRRHHVLVTETKT